jgi:hypothetical protein
VAAEVLLRHGFTVRRLEEGFPEWRAAGLPVEAGVGVNSAASNITAIDASQKRLSPVTQTRDGLPSIFASFSEILGRGKRRSGRSDYADLFRAN